MTTISYETALLVYEHLAEMGYEVAQSNAAWMYEKHLGVTIRESGWPTIVSFSFLSLSYCDQLQHDIDAPLGICRKSSIQVLHKIS